MSHENISININNDIDDIDDDNNNDLKNEINKLDNKNVDDVDNHVHIHKPAYIDKPIIEVSPNGEYLVVYNPEDQSIVGWNAKNIEEGQLTKSDAPVKVNDSKDKKTEISDSKDKITEISDSKDQITEISDSKDQITEISDSKIQVTEISVSDDKKLACSFNKDNECCLKIIDIDHKDQEIRLNLGGENKIIRIFSTQTINNKWELKSHSISIFSLDLENDTSIYNLELLPLLPSLFPLLSSNTQDSIIKHCWKECLNRLRWRCLEN
ncbi:unnamed protein product [Rhizophagus irregularis]|nr:unnamed protein product [Rhizophagus irregularis]